MASGTRPKVRLPSVPNLVIDADLTLSQLPPRKGSIPTTRAFPSTHTSLLPNAIPADSPSLVHGRDLLAPILALPKVGAFISVLPFRADRLTSSVPSPSPPPPTASPPPPPPPFASTPAPPLPSNPFPSVSTSLGNPSLTSSSSYAASTDAGRGGQIDSSGSWSGARRWERWTSEKLRNCMMSIIMSWGGRGRGGDASGPSCRAARRRRIMSDNLRPLRLNFLPLIPH